MNFILHHIAVPVLCAIIFILGFVVVLKQEDIASLEHRLVLAERTAEARKELIAEVQLLQKVVANPSVRKVTVTAYNPTTDQCDADPLVAASMRKVRLGTIAVSRDLFDQGWVFGRKVRIEGLGIFEINDLMNKRFARRVDVFMWDENDAKDFGKRVSKIALLEI